MRYRDLCAHKMIKYIVHGAPPSPEQWTVNHDNLCTWDNDIDNLTYFSPPEQMRHSLEENKERKTAGPALSKPIIAWRVVGRFRVRAGPYMRFPSITDAAKALGLDPRAVCSVCNVLRGNKSHHGFSFCYAPEVLFDGEVWETAMANGKPLKGCHVTRYGRVRISGRVTFGSTGKHGYLFVKVDHSTYPVHKIIAETFLGLPPDPTYSPNHLNGIHDDNSLDNLEWASREDQNRHAKTLPGYKDRMRATVDKLSIAVKGKKIGGKVWRVFTSTTNAADTLAEETGMAFEHSAISGVCKGKLKQTNGFIFEYNDPSEFENLPNEHWYPVTTRQYEEIKAIGPPNNDELKKNRESRSSSVIVREVRRPEVVLEFPSSSAAGTYFNLKLNPQQPLTVSRISKGHRTGKPWRGYSFSLVPPGSSTSTTTVSKKRKEAEEESSVAPEETNKKRKTSLITDYFRRRE